MRVCRLLNKGLDTSSFIIMYESNRWIIFFNIKILARCLCYLKYCLKNPFHIVKNIYTVLIFCIVPKYFVLYHNFLIF